MKNSSDTIGITLVLNLNKVYTPSDNNYLFVLLFLLLVTSFGLNRPPSDQHKRVILYVPAFLSFCKYWSEDVLLWPKLVASNINNNIKSCVRRSTYFISF